MLNRSPKQIEDLVLAGLLESSEETRGQWESVLSMILRLRIYEPPLKRGQIRTALERLVAQGFVERTAFNTGRSRLRWRLSSLYMGQCGRHLLRRHRDRGVPAEGGMH